MKFSIIIPVYNVAPYLHACLDSVVAQDYVDWEAVCVDDGSTDESLSILREYAAHDSRVVVIAQENAGVSVARNVALARMTGDYFLFLDGDDLLKPRVLNYAAACLSASDAEAILTYPLFERFLDGVHPKLTSLPKQPTWTSVHVRRDLIVGPKGTQGFIAGRVLSRSKFGSVRFPVGQAMAEDLIYWIDILKISARWVMLEGAFEGYRQRGGSVCQQIKPSVYANVFDAYMYVVDALRDEAIFGSQAVAAYWNRWSGVYKMFLHGAYRQWKKLNAMQRKRVLKFNYELVSTLGFYPLDFVFRLRWWAGRLHILSAFEPAFYGLDCLVMGLKARLRRCVSR